MIPGKNDVAVFYVDHQLDLVIDFRPAPGRVANVGTVADLAWMDVAAKPKKIVVAVVEGALGVETNAGVAAQAFAEHVAEVAAELAPMVPAAELEAAAQQVVQEVVGKVKTVYTEAEITAAKKITECAEKITTEIIQLPTARMTEWLKALKISG